MKKLNTNLLFATMLSLGIATACNSNSSKAKEPEIAQMEIHKDSLKKSEEQVSKDIEDVQKSLKEVDKEFQTK